MSAAQEDGWVITSVSDHGPGIAPEDLPRLFQRYARTEAGRTRRESIGLYITRLLAEAHEGSIWMGGSVAWSEACRAMLHPYLGGRF